MPKMFDGASIFIFGEKDWEEDEMLKQDNKEKKKDAGKQVAQNPQKVNEVKDATPQKEKAH